jgi:hypothetical protein
LAAVRKAADKFGRVLLDGPPPRSAAPKLSFEVQHVWQLFCDLNRTRRAGFNGPEPLSYAEMLAWSELTGMRIRPWEIEVIMALDHEYMTAGSEDGKDES